MRKIRRSTLQSLVPALSLAPVLLFSAAGISAQTIVDCTGATTGAYTTISAALAATPALGANIQVVAGPCHETVNITGRYNLNLGAPTGKTVALTGSVLVEKSANVYLYGLNVTNATGNGIQVEDSRGVTLDTITSSGNKAAGLLVDVMANVDLYGPSAFDNNGKYGVHVLEFSGLDIDTSTGALDVSNNAAGGFFVYHKSGLVIAGNSTIENNGQGLIGHETGIAVHESSAAEVDDCTGNNVISGNVNSGIEVQGSSSAAVAGCGAGFQNLIENNGVYGAQVVLSSEMLVTGEAQISGNPQGGIWADGAASVFLNGNSLITNNGTVGNIDTGGVMIGNGSALESHYALVNSNLGWGFVGFLGGNLKIYNTTSTGNEFGMVGCDSSAHLYTDWTPNAGAMLCAIPTIPVVQPQKPLNGISPQRLSASRLPQTEPPDPAQLSRKVRQARAAFWKAMNGGLKHE